jgi:hypothetical protein
MIKEFYKIESIGKNQDLKHYYSILTYVSSDVSAEVCCSIRVFSSLKALSSAYSSRILGRLYFSASSRKESSSMELELSRVSIF